MRIRYTLIKIWLATIALGALAYVPLDRASGLIVEFDLVHDLDAPSEAFVRIDHASHRFGEERAQEEYASVWVPLANGRSGITHVKTKLPLPLARALCRIQLHYQSVPGRALIKNFTAYDALTHLRVKLTDNTLSSWTEEVKDAVFDRDPPYVFPAFRLYLFLLLNIVLLALPGAILLVILLVAGKYLTSHPALICLTGCIILLIAGKMWHGRWRARRQTFRRFLQSCQRIFARTLVFVWLCSLLLLVHEHKYCGLIVEFDFDYDRYSTSPAFVQIYYEPERGIELNGVFDIGNIWDGTKEHESVKVLLPNQKRGETHIRARLPLGFTQALRSIRIDYLNVPGKALIKNFTIKDAITGKLLVTQGACRPRCKTYDTQGKCTGYSEPYDIIARSDAEPDRQPSCLGLGDRGFQTKSLAWRNYSLAQPGALYLETEPLATDAYLEIPAVAVSPLFRWWWYPLVLISLLFAAVFLPAIIIQLVQWGRRRKALAEGSFLPR